MLTLAAVPWRETGTLQGQARRPRDAQEGTVRGRSAAIPWRETGTLPGRPRRPRDAQAGSYGTLWDAPETPTEGQGCVPGLKGVLSSMVCSTTCMLSLIYLSTTLHSLSVVIWWFALQQVYCANLRLYRNNTGRFCHFIRFGNHPFSPPWHMCRITLKQIPKR